MLVSCQRLCGATGIKKKKEQFYCVVSERNVAGECVSVSIRASCWCRHEMMLQAPWLYSALHAVHSSWFKRLHLYQHHTRAAEYNTYRQHLSLTAPCSRHGHHHGNWGNGNRTARSLDFFWGGAEIASCRFCLILHTVPGHHWEHAKTVRVKACLTPYLI